MTGVLIKIGNLGTGVNIGRTLYEDVGRDWCDTSTSLGMPKTARKLPEAMVRHKFFFIALMMRELGPGKENLSSGSCWRCYLRGRVK